MANVKRTPQRNTPGATRGAVPPKKSAVVRLPNGPDGKKQYVKTPNSADARATVRGQRNQAVKILRGVEPRQASATVESTPGRALGGKPKGTKIKSTTPSGVIKTQRGDQELIRTRAQGIRAQGGVPQATKSGVKPQGYLASKSNPAKTAKAPSSALQTYPVRMPDGTVFEVQASKTRYSKLSPDLRHDALLSDAFAQRRAAEEANKALGRPGTGRALHNNTAPVKAAPAQTPAARLSIKPSVAKAAASAHKGATGVKNAVVAGAKGLKGSALYKGVSQAVGVGASAGRVAARGATAAYALNDAFDRERTKGQDFIKRGLPTAAASSVGGWQGARAGTLAGAKVGSMLGPKGALVGGVLGGVGGSLVGYDATAGLIDAIVDGVSGSKSKSKPPSTPARSKPIGNGNGGITKPVGGKKSTQRANQVPVTPDSNRDPEFRSSGGWVGNPNDGRPQPLRSPAIGAPVHASPSAFGSGQNRGTGSAYVGSSAATPPRPSSPAQAALAGDPASETYRDGGKGLYQGTQAYRDAVGGSGNPLLNRFRNEMGLDPATGARPQQAGQPQQAAPAAKAEPKMSAQYDGNDEPGRLGQAENPMQALMELLKKNKLKIQVN
jgi:hypothetical protein